MKFVVSSSVLLKQLQQINGVIQTNSVLPILEDFLFEIEKNQLTVTATDLETMMRVKLEVEARESGRVCIPAKILMDTLKNLPDQPLAFSIDNNFGIDITSDNGKYKVAGENPDNYPKEPEQDGTTAFTMTSGGLVTAISKTIFAVAMDEMRPAMTGVFFELFSDGLQTVATDAHRLVKYRRKDVSCPSSDSFIVPRKPLLLLKSSLPTNEDPISINYNNSHLFVQHKDTLLSCRLIDSRFPDYKVVIPADNPYKLHVAKADFTQALRRISIFSNKSTNQVVLSITGSQLQLSAQDIDFNFEGNEKMPCSYDGEDLAIAFNAKFLIEMLNATDTEEVVLELSGPTKAGILKPSEQGDSEDMLMLAMPLMINN
jgi:DNA polymerase III subunit beta